MQSFRWLSVVVRETSALAEATTQSAFDCAQVSIAALH